MNLTEATLQAILDLQEQRLIIGDPAVAIAQEGDVSVVTLNVQMPLPLLHLNNYLDLVYRTLEDTSTKACMIIVEITPHESLGWEEA